MNKIITTAFFVELIIEIIIFFKEAAYKMSNAEIIITLISIFFILAFITVWIVAAMQHINVLIKWLIILSTIKI